LDSKKILIDSLKETLDKYGQITLNVHGDSMIPTLHDNQSVAIYKNIDIKIGDIIAYYFFDDSTVNIIVHRVIFVRQTYVLAKGDNNNFIDPLKIKYYNILGTVKIDKILK
jgi:peptidase S24-like